MYPFMAFVLLATGGWAFSNALNPAQNQHQQSVVANPMSITMVCSLMFCDISKDAKKGVWGCLRSYTHFCACGKAVDSRLEQLGGQRCAPRADINREDWKAVDGWIAAVLASLSALPLQTLQQRSAGARPTAKQQHSQVLSYGLQFAGCKHLQPRHSTK